MKTFDDLKVGDIVFSKAKDENVIAENQIGKMSFTDNRVGITFVNNTYVDLDRDAIAYIKYDITYFADKKAIPHGLKTMIKHLEHELQTCEQLLKQYESENIK